MPFTITHLDGTMEPGLAVDLLRDVLADLLAELNGADIEHPGVAITDESGWTLSAFASRKVVWENVESDNEPGHLEDVSPEEVARLFTLLTEGELAQIAALPWSPGYS